MDLVAQRYPSPFLFMDSMIQYNRFDEWVSWLIRKVSHELDEKTSWEFYLHKDFESESFAEFRSRMHRDTEEKKPMMTEEEKTEIINKSENILNGFIPK